MSRMIELAPARAATLAAMMAGHNLSELGMVVGRFHAKLFEREGGPLLWEDDFDNIVCTVGKNLAFNTLFAGAGFTTVGPFLGLITSTSFSAVSAADTMASHAGWLEGGGTNAPAYSGNRPLAVFAAASAGSISLSAALTYTFTSGGTVQGAFLLTGAGALNTKDNTAGTLWSAGAFGAAQPVISGNVLSVSYTSSM